MGLIMEALDSGLLDRSVHLLDLPVGPRMSGLGQALIDAVLGAGILKGMSPEDFVVLDRLPDVGSS